MFIITFRYNEIRFSCSDVEFELLQEEIQMIDGMIDEGQINYNWNSPGEYKYMLFNSKETAKSFMMN